MLVHEKLSKSYCVEPVQNVVYLNKWSPTHIFKDNISCDDFHGPVFSYGHLRTFGFLAYVNFQKEKHKNLGLDVLSVCLYCDKKAVSVY